MPTQLQKAYLEVETGARISCMFNPAKFRFATANRWESDRLPGREAPTLRFAGGEGGSFSLSLTFDTTDTGKSVTEYTKQLLKLMEIDTGLPGYDQRMHNGRPPWVKFHWGTHVHTFKAVVVSTDVTFTYFSEEGLPLRASVELALEQYEADANWGAQNPTSGTPNPKRTHQVQPGETLDRIAAKYYADSTQWRAIALLNGITDPLDIEPGALLSIPERSPT
jgi:LysM repeat protein